MSKKVKILLSLIGTALLVVLYIIFTSKSVKINKIEPVTTNKNIKTKSVAQKINLEDLASKYRQATVKILADYGVLMTQNKIKSASTSLNNLASSTNTNIASSSSATSTPKVIDSALGVTAHNKNLAIINLKDRLLALKVPAEYQDLHINLILAFNELEKYFNNNDKAAEIKAKNIFQNVQNKYSWLSASSSAILK